MSTVGDEMKNAASQLPAQSTPKVFGLSLKDRSAIMPVGHRADAASWLDVKNGVFVTSTHYRAELHPWAAKFNQPAPADKYAGRKWELLDAASGSARVMPPTPGPATVIRGVQRPVWQRAPERLRRRRHRGRTSSGSVGSPTC